MFACVCVCLHLNLFEDGPQSSFKFLECVDLNRSNWQIWKSINFLIHSIYAVVIVSTSWMVSVNGFKFVPEQREVVYEYVGSVIVEAQAPWDEVSQSPPQPTGWKVRGTFKLQRIDANTLAAAVSTCSNNYTSEQ